MNILKNTWSCSPFSTPDPSDYTVYLGRQSQELPNPNEVSRSVSQVILHPEYDNISNNNDMALLRLSSPVNFTNFVRPVCLAAEGSTFNSDTMWVTGWGTIYSGGKKQDFVHACLLVPHYNVFLAIHAWDYKDDLVSHVYTSVHYSPLSVPIHSALHVSYVMKAKKQTTTTTN